MNSSDQFWCSPHITISYDLDHAEISVEKILLITNINKLWFGLWGHVAMLHIFHQCEAYLAIISGHRVRQTLSPAQACRKGKSPNLKSATPISNCYWLVYLNTMNSHHKVHLTSANCIPLQKSNILDFRLQTALEAAKKTTSKTTVHCTFLEWIWKCQTCQIHYIYIYGTSVT